VAHQQLECFAVAAGVEVEVSERAP
jgi:hypothetical protein